MIYSFYLTLLAAFIFIMQSVFLGLHLPDLPRWGIQGAVAIGLANATILLILMFAKQHLRGWLHTRRARKAMSNAILPLHIRLFYNFFASAAVTIVFTMSELSLFPKAVYEIFFSTTGDSFRSASLAAAVVVITTLIVSVPRFIVLICTTVFWPDGPSKRILCSFIWLPVLHVAELVCFEWVPAVRPLSFPLPVVLHNNIAMPVSDAGQMARPTPYQVFLYNPNLSHRIRRQVFYLAGSEGFLAAGKLLGMEIRTRLVRPESIRKCLFLKEARLWFE